MDAQTFDHSTLATPAPDCARCLRLGAGRGSPPALPQGPLTARLLIVAMAPHPADQVLAASLDRLGLARGPTLIDTRITHAVRCVPPRNLPTPSEVRTCNPYLAGELAGLPNLRAVLALGVLAHAAVLSACGIPPERIRYAHGAIHELPDGLILADCHPLSGTRLTPEWIEAALLGLLLRLDQPEQELGFTGEPA